MWPKGSTGSDCIYLYLNSRRISRMKLSVLKTMLGLLTSWEPCRFTQLWWAGRQGTTELCTESPLPPLFWKGLDQKAENGVSYLDKHSWIFFPSHALNKTKQWAVLEACCRHCSHCDPTITHEADTTTRPHSTLSKGQYSRLHSDEKTSLKRGWGCRNVLTSELMHC